MKKIVLIVLLIALAAGLFAWRRLEDLEGRIGGLVGQVADLKTDLEVAEGRARTAEARAETAEERAAAADRDATEAVSKALSASEQASTAEERAAAAAQAQTAAEQDKADALEIARIRNSEAKLAELERADARQQLDRLREQRENDLQRLQRAFEKIAETRRTAMGLVMRLGGESIEFDFDKAALRPENREVLARIAGILLTAEDYQIQVFGHTDDVGSVEYNQDLSARRAAAVRGYLVEAGIDPAIISTKGFGKSSPLVDGSDPQSRQRNRRVEIAITQTTGEIANGPLAPSD